MKKKKILVLSDHPLSPSGVGTQTRYMIEALLKTGRYEFVCLGGAMKHQDYTPVRVDPWGDDWRIFPVDGYGNHEIVRSIMQKERPDVLWFMTDPRFYEWLWEIENENARWYRSNDHVACISKVTYQVVQGAAPDVECSYLPHAVPDTVFHPSGTPEEKAAAEQVRQQVFDASSMKNPNKKIFFWNSRNARRKQSGTLIWWFKEWLDDVGHDKASLLMHTDPRDPHGQDLPHIIEHLGITDGQVLLSSQKVAPDGLASMYRAADYTIGISDAEGFGLSTLESLTCGTPIIVNMTGGLQEQVTDGKNWFGWGIQPSSKAIIGSLQVPYIYEDRISQQDFNKVLNSALKLTAPKYKKMSEAGLKHIKDNYSFEKYETSWVNLMDEIVEKHGSWENRTNHKRWYLMEVA
jgi:glycosyltransferase involved in cell wall biosynthesis